MLGIEICRLKNNGRISKPASIPPAKKKSLLPKSGFSPITKSVM
jgi:hypothetical protein